jgi:hypothetical protein
LKRGLLARRITVVAIAVLARTVAPSMVGRGVIRRRVLAIVVRQVRVPRRFAGALVADLAPLARGAAWRAATTVHRVRVVRRLAEALVVDPAWPVAPLGWVERRTVRTRERIDRALLVPAPHSTLAGRGAVIRDMGPWSETIARLARAERRFTAAPAAVGPARLARDAVRSRTRIDRALLVPARHSMLVVRGAVMREMGP